MLPDDVIVIFVDTEYKINAAALYEYVCPKPTLVYLTETQLRRRQ